MCMRIQLAVTNRMIQLTRILRRASNAMFTLRKNRAKSDAHFSTVLALTGRARGLYNERDFICLGGDRCCSLRCLAVRMLERVCFRIDSKTTDFTFIWEKQARTSRSPILAISRPI